MLREQERGHNGPITLGGHSSGGGFAIRFRWRQPTRSRRVSKAICLLAPADRSAPVAGVCAQGTARRLGQLECPAPVSDSLALNTIGIHGFNGLPLIEFNKPAQFWDGTETLSYSYRLNTSYHPRFRYKNDLRALGDAAPGRPGAGAQSTEAIDPEALRAVFAESAPKAQMTIVPGVSHFGHLLRSGRAVRTRIAAWLRSPCRSGVNGRRDGPPAPSRGLTNAPPRAFVASARPAPTITAARIP